MAFTVTATFSGGTGTAGGGTIRVTADLGAKPASQQNGGTASGSSASQSLDPSVTVAAVGSVIYGATCDFTAATAPTPDARTTFTDSVAYASGDEAGTFRSTAATAATGATAFGATAPATDAASVAAAEILAAPGQTISEDASTSSAVTTVQSGSSVTSPSISPPAGSLLVVRVAGVSGTGGPTGATISDTSGLGLTWTRLVQAGSGGGTNYAGVFVAQIPAAAAGAAPSLPPAQFPPLPMFGPWPPFYVTPSTPPPSGAVTQQGAATLGLATAVAAPAVVLLAPATLAAALTVSAPSVLIPGTAALAAALGLTAPAVQLAPATLAVAAAVASPAVLQLAPASLAAALAVTGTETEGAPATVAAALAVAAPAVLLAPAQLAAALSLGPPPAVQSEGTAISVAGGVTAAGPGTGATLATVLAVSASGLVVQFGAASPAVAAALTAPAQQQSSTLIAALLALTATERQLAAALLTGAVQVSATGLLILPPPPFAAQLGAGEPDGRWAAGEPQRRWNAAGEPGGRWRPGEPSGRYAAGEPAGRWAAGEPQS